MSTYYLTGNKCIMSRLISSIIVLTLGFGFSFKVVAEEVKLPDLDELDTYQWNYTDNQFHSNRDKLSRNDSINLLRKAAEGYLESKFTSLGVPQRALSLTGAAIVFATGQDAKFHLNESKTMSLQVKDADSNNRAILYRLKYSW